MSTTVGNIYKHPEGPNTVYIGREGKGRDGYFGNPFKLSKEKNRESVLAKYKKYFYQRLAIDNEFYEKVLELEGKVLLCFCSPKLCHGDIIAEWLNDQEG